ncbi:Dipeptidyl-peptidase 5 [Entamoeba marina]
MFGLLGLLVISVFAFTTDDLLYNTGYVVKTISNHKNDVYYIVSTNTNDEEVLTLYRTDTSNDGSIVMEIASGVGKDMYYDENLETIFYTKCSSKCSLYSIDKNYEEYVITSDIDVSKPLITSDKVYFITPVFFGFSVANSIAKQEELQNRGTTSHKVHKQTPIGSGDAYIITTDDGVPLYNHLVSTTFTVDADTNRISVGEYTDISSSVGNVISFDVDSTESIITFEGKSTSAANDINSYLKSSIYMIRSTEEELTCLTCNTEGSQTLPKSFLDDNHAARYFVVYNIDDQHTKAQLTSHSFNFDDYIISSHSTEESIIIYFRGFRKEARGVKKLTYSVSSQTWDLEEVTVSGVVTDMTEVPCKDDSSCLVISLSKSNQPSELYFVDSDFSLSQITDINDYSSYDLNDYVEIAPMSNMNDRLQALLYTTNVDNAPLLVVVHDEESGSVVDGFSKVMNPYIYTSQGYAVVMVNVHGSEGYGERYRLNAKRDMTILHEDIQAVITEISNGDYSINTEKVAIVGVDGATRIISSILASGIDFTCAAVHGGILSLRAQYYTEGTHKLEEDLEGPHYENPYWYSKNEIIHSVTQFNIPTIISYGDLDFVVDKSQCISLFPQSSNQLVNSADIKTLYEQYLTWFDAYLKN